MNVINLLIFAITVLTLSPFDICRAQSNSSDLYDVISRLVVRLEHKNILNRAGQDNESNWAVPDGTAFVVRYRDVCFIITARHVADQGFDLFARMMVRDRDSQQFVIRRLHLPKESWIFHPDYGNDSTRYVDIAVAKLPPSLEISYTQIQESLLAAKDPMPPSPILVFGFPGDVGFALNQPRPMAKVGIISMKAEQDFIMADNKYCHKDVRLVDALTFPGNSGSPVFSSPNMELCAIIFATNENLSFSICEPISKIRETLDYALANEKADSLQPKWED